jgi:hypothetical protein
MSEEEKELVKRKRQSSLTTIGELPDSVREYFFFRNLKIPGKPVRLCQKKKMK